MKEMITNMRATLFKVWTGEDSLLVNSFFLFGILIATSGFGFLVWIAATRFYLPADVGMATTIISTSQMLTGLAGLGLGMGLIKFLPASDDPARMVNAALVFTVLATLTASLVYVLGAPVWSPSLAFLTSRWQLLVGFVVCAPIFGSYSLIQMVFQAMRKSKYGFWLVIAINLPRLLLTIVLARWGAAGIILAVVAGMLPAILLGLFVYLPRVMPDYSIMKSINLSYLRQLIPFSLGVHIALQMYQLPILLTPLLVMERLGPAQSANAYIAWMLGALIFSAGQAIAGSAYAEGSHDLQQFTPVFKRSLRLSFWITCGFALVLGFGAPWVLSLFGEAYQMAVPLLVWMALAAPLVSMNRVHFSRMQIFQQMNELIGLAVLSTVIFLAAFFLLVDRTGLIAVGTGWLLAQGVVYALCAGKFLLDGVRK